MDFKERFGVTPPVKYIEKSTIRKCYLEEFQKSYKKFFKKFKPCLSKTRSHQIKKFFEKLENSVNDLAYCEKVSLRFISKKVGYGVFAKQDIPPYTVLHHYVGEMLPTRNLKDSHDSTFSFEHFPDFSLDAMKRGNWARFMNHSDVGTEANNITVWEYYDEDGPKIVFTSGSKGIKKGAQLLYSYGEEYWSDRKALNLK